MEGLIPLVYRAIVEYRKARHQVAIGSRLLYGDHHQPCASSALFCVDPAGSSSSWHAASSSLSPATSPAAARASASLASPLLRSASRRQFAAVFQSLLYEAAGRTINPVSGAVGLLGAGSWQPCQAAVETVLRGGAIGPLPEFDVGRDTFALAARRAVGCSTFSTAKRAPTTTRTNVGTPPVPPPEPSCDLGLWLSPGSPPAPGERRRPGTPSMTSEESVTTATTSGGGGGGREPELLNLFV